MKKGNDKNKSFREFLKKNGFYIALVVCVAPEHRLAGRKAVRARDFVPPKRDYRTVAPGHLVMVGE